MGLGQPEIALEVPSIQAQLLEKVVKFFKLAACLESLMDPDAATSPIIFHLPQKVQSCAPCYVPMSDDMEVRNSAHFTSNLCQIGIYAHTGTNFTHEGI